MKPIYANTFNITRNENNNEIAITFTHVYTDHNFAVRNNSLVDASAKVCDDVASILLNREGLIALANLLNRAIENSKPPQSRS